MKPALVVFEAPVEEAAPVAAAHVEWKARSNLESAEEVYHRYYSADSLLEMNLFSAPTTR